MRPIELVPQFLHQLSVTGLTFFRIGNHFSGQLKVIPDGVIFTVSAGSAIRGITASGSANLYFSFKDNRLYYFFSSEGGVAPLTIWPKQTQLFATGFGVGLVFNTVSVSDLGAYALNSYLPINAMAGAKGSFFGRLLNRVGWKASANFEQVYSYMSVLARHMNALAGRKTWYRISKKQGTLVASTSITNSLTSGAAVIGWQARDIAFGTTYAYAQQPRELISDITSLPAFLRNGANELNGFLPHLEKMLENPQQASVAFERVMDILASS